MIGGWTLKFGEVVVDFVLMPFSEYKLASLRLLTLMLVLCHKKRIFFFCLGISLKHWAPACEFDFC